MICLVCNRQFPTGITCPACGRTIQQMKQLEKQRDKFLLALLFCHIPWVLVGALLLYLLFTTPNKYTGTAFALECLLLVVEFAIVVVALRPLDASQKFRKLFCIGVALLPIIATGCFGLLTILLIGRAVAF